MMADHIKVYEELSQGGEWLGAARRWLQSNVLRGDTMFWSDPTPVSIPFCKLEEFALRVAMAAVEEERRKVKSAGSGSPGVPSSLI